MTHPTYTHPGANARMLDISRAIRNRVLITRARNAWKGTPLETLIATAEREALENVKFNLRLLHEHNWNWIVLTEARREQRLTAAGVEYMKRLEKRA